MSKLLTFALMLCVVGSAAATNLGNQPPEKIPTVVPENIPNPQLQGGDNIGNAFPIPDLAPGAQWCDSGTTTGYFNDYDEACPYTGSTSPDVVYSYTPSTTGPVSFDLCGSAYDTKLYVYDASLSLIACNDDYYFSGDPCGDYVSFIDCFILTAGTTYYIVVDGYFGDFGDYTLCAASCVPPQPCDLVCPTDAGLENEPPLVTDYIDTWNGGCNTPPNYPFQHIYGWCPPQPATLMCGVSGWYDLSNGTSGRDTDWFTLCIGPTGCIQIVIDAELPTYAFELTGTCPAPTVAQFVTAGPCLPATMQICGTPGTNVWFWVGPTTFDPPAGSPPVFEYDYVLQITGLCCEVIQTEGTTWSNLKALYE